jgi:hypothetical protein
MPLSKIRETTTLDTPPPAKPGGTVLREVTRLEEPRPKKPAATPAKP